MAILDPGPTPEVPLPTTPPVWGFGKAGGGLGSPVLLDPTTGEYIDPFTGQGTGTNVTGDPVQNSYTGNPVRTSTLDPSSVTPPAGYHWQGNVLVQDPPAGGPPSGSPPAGPPGPPPSTPGVTGPFTPPDTFRGPPNISGQMPTVAPSRGQAFRGGNESFASLIPRAAGNSVRSPSDISGARPNVPAWAQGLMRSPYARFLARGGQSSSFSAMPGFGQVVAPVDAEQRRQQEMAALPAWAQPV